MKQEPFQLNVTERIVKQLLKEGTEQFVTTRIKQYTKNGGIEKVRETYYPIILKPFLYFLPMRAYKWGSRTGTEDTESRQRFL